MTAVASLIHVRVMIDHKLPHNANITKVKDLALIFRSVSNPVRLYILSKIF